MRERRPVVVRSDFLLRNVLLVEDAQEVRPEFGRWRLRALRRPRRNYVGDLKHCEPINAARVEFALVCTRQDIQDVDTRARGVAEIGTVGPVCARFVVALGSQANAGDLGQLRLVQP